FAQLTLSSARWPIPQMSRSGPERASGVAGGAGAAGAEPLPAGEGSFARSLQPATQSTNATTSFTWSVVSRLPRRHRVAALRERIRRVSRVELVDRPPRSALREDREPDDADVAIAAG